jgi:hypothetical protein
MDTPFITKFKSVLEKCQNTHYPMILTVVFKPGANILPGDVEAYLGKVDDGVPRPVSNDYWFIKIYPPTVEELYEANRLYDFTHGGGVKL